MRVLVASRNAKKLKELNRVLEAAQVTGIELVGLSDVPDYPETPETGATFADNARIKTADGVAQTGLPTIADDSGIAVDELRGMPGILSARWSGAHGDDEANNRLLLGQLGDTPDERRGALTEGGGDRRRADQAGHGALTGATVWMRHTPCEKSSRQCVS